MAKEPTAKKLRDLNNYSGEVALFELSKQVKKGRLGTKYVVIARVKPRSGSKNTTIWLADKTGVISIIEPIMEMVSDDMASAMETLGYKLV